ncbi:aldose 1-epimerase family protein [Ectobacillus panaciterrae]|uniref:aldose 1-epimerase family protein n=1 Tax=Ectobacillus panaciterrae TaxID=363872 RepID=UPI0003FA6375|nr:aldose 1-epimerase family protein [Ectobacillus panaciterrae]
MISTIANEHLRICVSKIGAELTSVRSKSDDTEYIWQADPAYWKRHAPVLFPIVGRLVENTYYVNGRSYTLPQHGFARDSMFELTDETKDSLTYRLASNEDTMQIYPFQFELYITYKLEQASLHIAYEVKNCGHSDMYFSIGAHPGFRVPLLEGEAYTDYYLQFSEPEQLATYTLDNGYITDEKKLLADAAEILPLSQELFADDAIILEGLNKNEISIRGRNHDKFIRVNFEGFPYVGIWSEGTGAPFVCIEPWYGMADKAGAPGELKDKKGIQILEQSKTFAAQYTITIG